MTNLPTNRIMGRLGGIRILCHQGGAQTCHKPVKYPWYDKLANKSSHVATWPHKNFMPPGGRPNMPQTHRMVGASFSDISERTVGRTQFSDSSLTFLKILPQFWEKCVRTVGELPESCSPPAVLRQFSYSSGWTVGELWENCRRTVGEQGPPHAGWAGQYWYLYIMCILLVFVSVLAVCIQSQSLQGSLCMPLWPWLCMLGAHHFVNHFKQITSTTNRLQ